MKNMRLGAPLTNSALDHNKMHSDTIIFDTFGFLKILDYVPKERENFSAKNEPSFVTVKCCDGS